MPISDRVVFENLSGYRPYDEAVLLFCYDGPKSRAEIQSLTTYKSPKGVIEGVINPLLRAGLLVCSKPGKAPNQSYFTNKKKVNKIESN